MDDATRRMSAPASSTGSEPDVDDRTRELREDIEQTREGIAETVDAIQDKLRPSNVIASATSAGTERVKSMANSAADTAGEWWESSGGDRLVDRLRAHPIATAMATAGIAWLAFSDGGNGHARYSRHYRQYRPTGAGEPRSSMYTDTGERRSTMQSMADAMPQPSEIRRRFRQGSNRVSSMIREYPLAVGAAALLLGASLGMVVPETERENELMGEARENTMRRAQEAASQAVGQVKEAAADVVTRATIGD
jgi:hypothetical protein